MENKLKWEDILGDIIEVIEIIGTPLPSINGKKVVYEEEVLNAAKLHHNKILDFLRQAEKEGKIAINPPSIEEVKDIIWQTAQKELVRQDPMALGMIDTSQMREKIATAISERIRKEEK